MLFVFNQFFYFLHVALAYLVGDLGWMCINVTQDSDLRRLNPLKIDEAK
jgi:hypothetical protein